VEIIVETGEERKGKRGDGGMNRKAVAVLWQNRWGKKYAGET
jgi:hypothetical protein